MHLPKGATVVVIDGETLNLFRNDGEGATPELTALPEPKIDVKTHSAGGVSHPSSSANNDDRRQNEDSNAALVASWLNKQALENKLSHVFIIAAPGTLGELRKHYHKALQAKLVGELAKDLTGRSVAEVQTALAHA
jgi:protein required for attachment to host cells